MLHPSKLLKELGISPLKQLGQNFQVDVHSVENAAAQIPAGAVILEIGPGLGAWTEVFLGRGHKMILVEKDRTLAARLKDKFAGSEQVTVHEGDVLEFDLESAEFAEVTAAVGNLPFYVTSEILLRLIVDCPRLTHGLFGLATGDGFVALPLLLFLLRLFGTIHISPLKAVIRLACHDAPPDE